MRRLKEKMVGKEDLFVWIDLHKQRWHVTIRTFDVELSSASLPGDWGSLCRLLERYAGHRLQAVYEAGYFGFWLYDQLREHGIECLVTPPSLVPQEYGNRVKTDRRDSRKLAHLLAKGPMGSDSDKVYSTHSCASDVRMVTKEYRRPKSRYHFVLTTRFIFLAVDLVRACFRPYFCGLGVKSISRLPISVNGLPKFSRSLSKTSSRWAGSSRMIMPFL